MAAPAAAPAADAAKMQQNMTKKAQLEKIGRDLVARVRCRR